MYFEKINNKISLSGSPGHGSGIADGLLFR